MFNKVHIGLKHKSFWVIPRRWELSSFVFTALFSQFVFLFQIFSNIDISDLARCARVCRSWKVITQWSALWSKVSANGTFLLGLKSFEAFASYIWRGMHFLICCRNVRMFLSVDQLYFIGDFKDIKSIASIYAAEGSYIHPHESVQIAFHDMTLSLAYIYNF